MQDLKKLIAGLVSGDADERLRAAEGLSQLGREARDAAVALVRAAGDQTEAVRDCVQATLEDLGPPTRETVDALGELLQSASADVAYWAATMLGRLGREASSAADALAAVLSDSPALHVRERAAWALGQIRAGSATVRAALAKATASTDKRLARLAQEALDALGG